MDPERTPRSNPEPLDDAALGALVREVADDWRMPPQRLDDVTWRERIGRRGRAGDGSGTGWRWTRRLVGATSLALVATVVLSVTAVFLTTPRSGPAVGSATATPTAGASGTPGASATPDGTPLPKLVRNGDLPSVTSFLIDDGQGSRLVDLTTGDASPSMFPALGFPHTVLARPDGSGWLCVCATTSAMAQRVDLLMTAGPGQAVERRDLRMLMGEIGTAGTDRPQATDAQVSVSPDGRFAFLGWSWHHPTKGWSAGVDVIDLTTLKTVTTVDLPSVIPPATKDLVWVRVAPTVAVSPSGDGLYISSDWFVWTADDVVPSGTDHWTASWDGTTAGSPIGAGSSTSDTCSEWGRGFIDDTQVYVVCYAGIPIVERRDLTGAVLARTEVPRSMGGNGMGNVMAVRDGRLYLWDPIDLVLNRVDLRTGDVITGQATRPTAAAPVDDLLATLGRRIGEAVAPSTAAKVLLQPPLAFSPDGSRVYALGVAQVDGTIGSSGVFVFDTATLAQVDHWDPVADFGSIAVSADGAFVYAAGGSGRDAAGVPNGGNGSITVYDASDGSVRLIAGDVLASDFWFQTPVLP